MSSDKLKFYNHKYIIPKMSTLTRSSLQFSRYRKILELFDVPMYNKCVSTAFRTKDNGNYNADSDRVQH